VSQAAIQEATSRVPIRSIQLGLGRKRPLKVRSNQALIATRPLSTVSVLQPVAEVEECRGMREEDLPGDVQGCQLEPWPPSLAAGASVGGVDAADTAE